jgi:glucosamine--fructose-6-phosphate aminotransferase (isomerizing)
VGRYAIEEWARVPVEMDIASECRYRNPVLGPHDPSAWSCSPIF